MSSKAQKNNGYPLPESLTPEDTLSFCVTIPNDPAFAAAMYKQLVNLGKWWNWKRDEDTRDKATTAAMTWREKFVMTENCGGFPVTPEEFYDANKRAIYDAINDVAKQIVSGRTTNISVDDEGTVSDPSTESPADDLPVDDPETVGDETLEAKSGGASAMRYGLNLIWSQMSAWYVGGVTAANIKQRIKEIYLVEPNETDGLVDAYFTARGAAQPYVSSFANTLDSYFFCKGQTKQMLARWIYDLQTSNLQSMSSLMEKAITQEQLNLWFAEGALVPSTDYVDYSCTKTPSETIAVTLDSNVFYSGVQTWKANHRIRFTVTGYQTDPQGDIIDFWWNRSAAGVLTFKSNDVMIRVNATEVADLDATSNEVPYNTGHSYIWTGICNQTGLMSIRINRGTGIDVATNYTWDVLVEDLGEIVT